MRTEVLELLHHKQADPGLYAAYLNQPLAPDNALGFRLATNDPDQMRAMEYIRAPVGSA